MPKMNWDRVRQWDRLRDGMSDLELAEERDEKRFAREYELLAARADRRRVARPVKTRPAPVQTSSAAPTARSDLKSLKLPALAERLGVTIEDVQAAFATLTEASSGLSCLTKPEKLSKAARRIGITPGELTLLRQALAGHTHALAQKKLVACLLRRVAHASVSPPPKPNSRKPAGNTPRPSSARLTGKAKQKKAMTSSRKGASNTNRGNLTRPKQGQGRAFVTAWGNVVHLFHDCHNARGFRSAGEADPDIYHVALSDPSCRGRRVCGTCSRSSPASAQKVDAQLRRFHGKPFDETEWQRQGWVRPKPSGRRLT